MPVPPGIAVVDPWDAEVAADRELRRRTVRHLERRGWQVVAHPARALPALLRFPALALVGPAQAPPGVRAAARALGKPLLVLGWGPVLAPGPFRARRLEPRLEPRVAVNVAAAEQPPAAQRHYEDRLVALLLSGWAGERRVTVFTTGDPRDAAAAERVALRLAPIGAELLLPADGETLARHIGASALVLASTAQAALLGLAERVPVLGLSAGRRLGEVLAALGLERFGLGPAAGALLARGPRALWGDQKAALRRARLPVAARRPENRGTVVNA